MYKVNGSVSNDLTREMSRKLTYIETDKIRGMGEEGM